MLNKVTLYQITYKLYEKGKVFQNRVNFLEEFSPRFLRTFAKYFEYV